MNHRKGAITLYFSIIFLSVVLVTVTTIDSARIAYSYASAHRAVNIAAQNVLTKYNYEFKDQFGMFGFEEGNLKNDVEFYIKNSSPFQPKSVNVRANPYDYKYNREQIIEYMKYRAPVNLIVDGADKIFNIFKEMEPMAEGISSVAESAETQNCAADFYEYLNDNIRPRMVGLKQNLENMSFVSTNTLFIKQLMNNDNDYINFSYYNDELKKKIPKVGGYTKKGIINEIDELYTKNGEQGQVGYTFPEIRGRHQSLLKKEAELKRSIKFVNDKLKEVYEHRQEEIDKLKKNSNSVSAEINQFSDYQSYCIDENNPTFYAKVMTKYKDKTSDISFLNYYRTKNVGSDATRFEYELEQIITHRTNLENFFRVLDNYTADLLVYYNFLLKIEAVNQELLVMIDTAETLRKEAINKIDATMQKIEAKSKNLDEEGRAINEQPKEDLLKSKKSLEEIQIKVQGKMITFPEFRQQLEKNIASIKAAKGEFRFVNVKLQNIQRLNNQLYSTNPVFNEKRVFDYIIPFTTKKIYNGQLLYGEDKNGVQFIDVNSSNYKLSPNFLNDYDGTLFYDLKSEYIELKKSSDHDEKKGQSDKLNEGAKDLKDSENVAQKLGQAKTNSGRPSSFEQKSITDSDKHSHNLPARKDFLSGVTDFFQSLTDFKSNPWKIKGVFEGIKNLVDFLSNFKQKIAEFFNSALENVYINEYVVGMFDSESTLAGIFEDELDLRFQNKTFDDNKLDLEVEYVIAGKNSDKDNRTDIGFRIVLLRMIPNMGHIFLKQMGVITPIAAALSFGIPFLVPIITFVLVVIWAFGESWIDLERLRRGNRVPFFKTQFVLSVSGAVDSALQVAEDKLTEVAENVVDNMQKGAQDLINEAFSQANVAIDGLSESIKNEAKNQTQQAINIAKSKYNEAKTQAISYVEAKINNNSIAQSGGDNLKNTIGEENFKKLEQFIENQKNNAISNIDAKVEEQLSGFKKKIDDELAEKVDEIAEGVKEKLNNAQNTANQQIQNAADKAKAKSKQVIQKGISSAKKKISAGIKKASSKSKKEGKGGGKGLLKLSYKDYMRIFLLFTNDDVKNARILDLHRMHGLKDSKWDTQNLRSYVEVEATYEVKYLFIPGVLAILNGGASNQNSGQGQNQGSNQSQSQGSGRTTVQFSGDSSKYEFKVQALMGY